MIERLLILMAFLLAPQQASGAARNSAVQTGSASAVVADALSLEHVAGAILQFGRLVVSSAGTVVVTTSGVSTTSGGVALAAGSSASTDRFIARGEPNRLISISTSGGVLRSGANAMTFTTTPMLPAGYIPTSGAGYFTVGGVLSVSLGQPAGTYSGTYVAAITYN